MYITIKNNDIFKQEPIKRSSVNRKAYFGSKPPCFPCSVCRTDEAAFGNVKLVASRSNPHATGADTDEARLALGVLGKEGHAQTFSNPLNRSSGGCGDSLCGLDQSLEKTALIKHHIVCDANLNDKVMQTKRC